MDEFVTVVCILQTIDVQITREQSSLVFLLENRCKKRNIRFVSNLVTVVDYCIQLLKVQKF